MASKSKWSMEAEYIQSCNCAYGCPCNFNARPTSGNCEALIAWRVRKGTFDGTKLDGVKVAWGLWWPKAIHEGGGVGRLYIDPKATPAQRAAIEAIWGGKHGGGVFTVFNSTFKRVLPAKSARIDWRFEGHGGGFSVEGIGEVAIDAIKNPVTGAAFEGQVLLPNGLNFKKANVVAVRKLVIHDDMPLNFEHRDTAGFTTVTRYSDKGPTSSSPP